MSENKDKYAIRGTEAAQRRWYEAVQQFRDAYWGDSPFNDHGFLVSASAPGYIWLESNKADRPDRDIVAIAKAIAKAAEVELIPFDEGSQPEHHLSLGEFAARCSLFEDRMEKAARRAEKAAERAEAATKHRR